MKFGKWLRAVKFTPAWLPVLLVLLAFGLRLFQNTVTPPSPYWEEVALGYDAYSILQTGRDHHGNVLPIVAFPSFGDYKPSLYFYTLVPSIAAFGLNVWAVRLPAVIFSALTVGVAFLLFQKWTNTRIATWAAFLLAIQPWSWQVGRVGFEVNLAVFLLISGVYTLNQASEYFQNVKKQKTFLAWSLLAATCLALSMYSYHGARLLAPLFGVATLLITFDWKSNWKKPVRLLNWLPAIILGFVLLAPLLMSLLSPSVQQRFNETSIFSDPQPVLLSNQYRELADQAWWSRIVYHRYVFWGQALATNYLKHFSLSFLFLQGDANPRHTSQYFGALYPWEALTLLVGVAVAAQSFRHKKAFWLLVVLTLLSPIAASVTTATPHALRALPLAVWLSLWSGIGMAELIHEAHAFLLKKKLLVKVTRSFAPLLNGAIIVFCLISMGILWVYYHYQYRVETANQWQYGYEPLISTLQNQALPGEQIFLSREQGRPAMYLFFFGKIDPSKVQQAESGGAKDQQEFLEFENWHFVDGQNTQPGLHAASPGLTPEKATVIQAIPDLQGKVIWNVYRQ